MCGAESALIPDTSVPLPPKPTHAPRPVRPEPVEGLNGYHSLRQAGGIEGFRVNLGFLANYVQSYHKPHYVCLFIKEKKDKKTAFLLPLFLHKTHTVCLFIDHTTCVFIKEKKDKKIACLISLSFPKSLIGKPHKMCAEGRTLRLHTSCALRTGGFGFVAGLSGRDSEGS
jgi:hypothetical protein